LPSGVARMVKGTGCACRQLQVRGARRSLATNGGHALEPWMTIAENQGPSTHKCEPGPTLTCACMAHCELVLHTVSIIGTSTRVCE
jgi:hypothetical protein